MIGNEYKFDPATLTDSQLLAHSFWNGDLTFAGDRNDFHDHSLFVIPNNVTAGG